MATRVAIAFDIDGVFKHGEKWSEDGLRALQRVSDAGLPFVFVTNGGGGLTEAAYGTHLKETIVQAGSATGTTGDIELPEAKRMVLSYTPWERTLARDYADKRILLVGDPREAVLNVAKSYGFTRVTHYTDYAIMHPTVNPFRQAMEAATSHTAVANATQKKGASIANNDKDEGSFECVLVMCDPYRWYEAMQISIDILCSPHTPLTLDYDPAAAPVPIHFSNPDLLSKFEHPLPRFAQGAFKVALKALYIARLRALRVPEETIDERVGSSFRQWGKPTEATFRFVEERLRSLVPAGTEPVTAERFYMVGDNPMSDLEGVRRANIFHRGSTTSWRGVLVRTGVYREGDEINGADKVVDGIAQAVDWILEQEGFTKEPPSKKRQV